MSTKINIIAEELAIALDYVAPAVGTKASAKQEPGLVYLKTFPKSNKMLVQVQGNLVCAQTLVTIDTTSTDNLEGLCDFVLLNSYIKNSKKDVEYTFDFNDIQDDILHITAGDAFIATLKTFPLDAYEVLSFKESTDISEVPTKKVQTLLKASCQFANMRNDAQDYVQITLDNKILSFFSQGDSLALFRSTLDSVDDFDVTVKASALQRLKDFRIDNIKLQLSDDGFFLVFKEPGIGLRAIVLHTDPPITLQEFQEDYDEEIEKDYALSWSVDEMSSVLATVQGSSSDGYFNFFIPSTTSMVVKTENQQSDSTKMTLNITTEEYNETLLKGDTFRSNLALFKKINILNKDDKKVNLVFNSNDHDYDEPYVETMSATGSFLDLEYIISFNVVA